MKTQSLPMQIRQCRRMKLSTPSARQEPVVAYLPVVSQHALPRAALEQTEHLARSLMNPTPS